MKNKIVSRLLASLSTLVFILALSPSTFAIGIRPVREEVSVAPGASKTGEITVINETDQDFMAEPVVKVFYKTDESGVPVYAEDEIKEGEDVRKWLDLPKEPVNVPAKGSTVVSYTLNVPANAEAGGKYMSIAYQPIKDLTQGVAVNVRAASLLLINVEGDIIKSGELADFKAPEEKISDQPIVFKIDFKNTGTTHVKPIGWIEILDIKANKKIKEIAQYADPITGQTVNSDKIPVNLTEGNVLPKNARSFEGEWSKNIKDGDYKAILSLKFDEKAEPLTRELPFTIDEVLKGTDLMMSTTEGKTHFDFEISNQGNVTEKLSGSIAIENVFGYKVDEIPLSEGEKPEYLAPGEKKDYQLNWGASEIPAGRYTAKLKVNYGYNNETLNKEMTFGEADRTQTYLIGSLALVVLISIFIVFKIKRGKSEKKD